jgi:carbon storage regulator
MLVLTRRIGEELWIADEIRVKVVTVTGNQVRLSITAPAAVAVAQPELLPESRSATGRHGQSRG